MAEYVDREAVVKRLIILTLGEQIALLSRF